MPQEADVVVLYPTPFQHVVLSSDGRFALLGLASDDVNILQVRAKFPDSNTSIDATQIHQPTDSPALPFPYEWFASFQFSNITDVQTVKVRIKHTAGGGNARPAHRRLRLVPAPKVL